jgi:hypothetical protein
MRHSPSLPEIVRVDTSSVDSAVADVVSLLEPPRRTFNYLDATKRTRQAYSGFHDLRQLLSAGFSRKKLVGHEQNMEVVRLAAPHAFGRATQIFDLPPRKLSYGADRFASYRVPFFFVERGIVKVYFLQPRKDTHFSTRQFGLLASVIKRNLLETEFYGETCDIEIIDVSRDKGDKKRSLHVYSLSDVPNWTDKEIEEHFSVVNDALKIVEEENLIKKVRRPLRDRELPLFD